MPDEPKTAMLACPACGSLQFYTTPDGMNSWILVCVRCRFQTEVSFPPTIRVQMYAVEHGPVAADSSDEAG